MQNLYSMARQYSNKQEEKTEMNQENNHNLSKETEQILRGRSVAITFLALSDVFKDLSDGARAVFNSQIDSEDKLKNRAFVMIDSFFLKELQTAIEMYDVTERGQSNINLANYFAKSVDRFNEHSKEVALMTLSGGMFKDEQGFKDFLNSDEPSTSLAGEQTAEDVLFNFLMPLVIKVGMMINSNKSTSEIQAAIEGGLEHIDSILGIFSDKDEE